MLFLSTLLDVVFPRCCILCNNFSRQPIDLCSYCADLLPQITSRCYRCAKPLPSDQNRCGQCLLHPPEFDQAWALYAYQPPITSLIKHYKFHRKYAFSATFSALMINSLEQAIDNKQLTLPEAIIAMPQHWSRTMRRGFNQSMELSSPIATHFSLPHIHKAIKRIKRTQYQTHLTPHERTLNLNNAFKAVNSIQYSHIAIIDDILTTGASANALARTLKQAGVKKVSLWTLATTTPL